MSTMISKPGWRIQIRAQAPDAYQGSLFNTSRPEPEPEPECDHVGTGRESQPTLFGTVDTVCSRCGKVIDTA